MTGGAALVGFHLHHRTTSDLDLFTLDESAHERARSVIHEVAARLEASMETKHDSPGFQRHLLTRGAETVLVDLVLDRTVQIRPEKPIVDGIPVDPPEEILANKLTALVARSEERDLVDVMCLDRAGYRVEDALDAALRKDGGCTPAQIAFVLSEIHVPDGAILPAGISPIDFRKYTAELIRRLRRAAMPRSPSRTS